MNPTQSQVTMKYEENHPTKVTSIVISTQHSKDLNQEKLRNNNSIYQKSYTKYLNELIQKKFI